MTVAMKKTLALLLLLAGLSGEVRAETLIWNGSGNDMTWNTENGNWLLNGAHAVYANGNDVVFGDTGNGFVSLSGELAPASVLVKSDNYYHFCKDIGESNKLTGTMQLTKEGEGKLTITTANDYTGGTVIKGGTLQMGNAKALGNGTITLGDNSILDLGDNTISNSITLQGNATIGNGKIDGTITGGLNVTENKSLTLMANASISGSIYLGAYAALDLGDNTISNSITLQNSAWIGNGKIESDLYVAEGETLALCGDLGGTGRIYLGDNSFLNLGENTISNSITLQGSARIGDGKIESDLYVGAGKTLTLSGTLSCGGSIYLGDDATLDLGYNTIYTGIIVDGSNATIGSGKIEGNLVVGAGKSLSLCAQLSDGGSIYLGDNSILDLGYNTIYNSITLQGSARIGNGKIGGTIIGNLNVAENKSLTLMASASISGTITLGDNSFLDLDENTIYNSITLQGSARIGNGKIGGTIIGNLNVAENKGLTLMASASISGTITLGDNSFLDLGENTIPNSITLRGNASIVGGTIEGDLVLKESQTLYLTNTDVTGNITLGDKAALDSHMTTIHPGKISLTGDSANIKHGTIAGDLTAEGNGNKTLFLLEDTTITGNVEVQAGALNIMNVDAAGKLNVADVAINSGSLGVYKGKTAAEANEGTLTISNGHRLTAGVGATLNANLVMESGSTLDVSAAEGNGGLHMGSTVTLVPGNVLLSDDDMEALGALGVMGKYDLFNGVDALFLGGDFLSELGLADKWVKAADVFANPALSAEKEYYLFYSGQNQGGAGGNAGTVYLMQIPEPTTGTLSLLALAGLCARRRRK